jgi:hypothetical protein
LPLLLLLLLVLLLLLLCHTGFTNWLDSQDPSVRILAQVRGAGREAAVHICC